MFDNKNYWNERLKDNYNLIGVGDISLSLNYNKWSYKITHAVLKNLLKKYTKDFTNNPEVLDIGSGTGFVVSILKELRKKITGVDISSVAVQRLSELYKDASFINLDAGKQRFDFPDGKFSCCVAASVLYHIVMDDELKFALANIFRVLAPGGYFIFSDNFIHREEFNITHQKCRTLDQYSEMIIAAGFEIVERVPNYYLMNDPVDTKNRFLKYLWHYNYKWSRSSKMYDAIIWPLLYPGERLLTAFCKESPAQEFMICRKNKS